MATSKEQMIAPEKKESADTAAAHQNTAAPQNNGSATKPEAPKPEVKVNAESRLIKDMPKDLLNYIFGMLSLKDGAGLYRVSKPIAAVVTSEAFEFADGKRLDFCLMIDATGSMGAHLDTVKLTLRNVVKRIQEHELVRRTDTQSKKERRTKFHTRLGWIEYRDFDDEVPYRVLNFTQDVEKVQKYIENAKAEGGGDFPEDVSGALLRADQDLRWTANPHCNAQRIITIVLDAPPHGMGVDGDKYPNGGPKPFPPSDWLEIAYRFKRRGIIVNPILCNTNCDELNLFGTTIARITGGKCFHLGNVQGLEDCLVAQICAELEFDEILEKHIKKAKEKSGFGSGSGSLEEEVLASITADTESTLPTAEGVQLVSHDKSENLAQCRSIKTARKLGCLKTPPEAVQAPVAPSPILFLGTKPKVDADKPDETEKEESTFTGAMSCAGPALAGGTSDTGSVSWRIVRKPKKTAKKPEEPKKADEDPLKSFKPDMSLGTIKEGDELEEEADETYGPAIDTAERAEGLALDEGSAADRVRDEMMGARAIRGPEYTHAIPGPAFPRIIPPMPLILSGPIVAPAHPAGATVATPVAAEPALTVPAKRPPVSSPGRPGDVSESGSGPVSSAGPRVTVAASSSGVEFLRTRISGKLKGKNVRI